MASKPKESLEQLAEIAPASERTQTISVISRKAAKDSNNEWQEVSNPVDVFVRPLSIRKTFHALTYFGAIIEKFPQGELDLNDGNQLAMWAVSLLGQVPDEMTGMMCLATDQTPEFFDTIDPDEGIKIIVAMVEVNKDFFVQKVLPMLSEIAPNLQETFGRTA